MNAESVGSQPRRTIHSHEVLLNDPLLKDFANIFDLEESINFTPAYLRDSDVQPPHTPLGGAYEDIISHILVLQEKDTRRFRFILIDQAEAEVMKELLKQEAANPFKGHRSIQPCLYSLDTGIEQQGSDRFNEKQLEKNPLFQKLRIQAKFRRGDQNYSPEEMAILKPWIARKRRRPNGKVLP